VALVTTNAEHATNTSVGGRIVIVPLDPSNGQDVASTNRKSNVANQES
jgi:hypothetical protein